MGEFMERLSAARIIAIIRGDFPSAYLVRIAESLAAGGVNLLEITLNSRGALEEITRLRGAVGPDAMVGAGTVRTPAAARQAIDAGAEFLVAPNFDAGTVDEARRAGVPHLPGVFTPTEAHDASAAGCRIVKLFPADSVGPAYLRAIRAPLDDIDFVAVGGVDAENVGDFIRAGAIAVGVGSSLVPRAEISAEELRGRAQRLAAAARST